MGPIVPTTPAPNAPGGNTVNPPAQPSNWPKMIIAIAIGSTMLWFASTMWDEQGAKWLAVITLGAIVTWYETHGNQTFSSGLSDLAKMVQ